MNHVITLSCTCVCVSACAYVLRLHVLRLYVFVYHMCVWAYDMCALLPPNASDYTPSRSRTPASEGGVRMHAKRIFTVSDEDVEEMLKTKVKGASKVGFCGVIFIHNATV